MKRLVVLLIVVALFTVSGISLTSAQENTQLKAVAPTTVMLYAEPGSGAEVVAEVAAGTEMTILATNRDGSWLEVNAAGSTGYVALNEVVVLNISALAPMIEVAVSSVSATSLFAEPDFAGEFLGAIDDGAVAKQLGSYGEWAYIETADGQRGWSIVSAWSALPAEAAMAQVTLGSVSQMGIFVEPKVGVDLAATANDGDVVIVLGAVNDEWVEVTVDGSTGYALAGNLAMLPTTYVETEVSNTKAGVFADTDFAADVVASLDDGVEVVYVGAVDDYWIEIYHPTFGVAYGLADHYSNVYFPAVVGTDDAVVRAGPSSFTYNGVAQIAAGTTVLVKGMNEAGDWYQVSIPLSEVDFGENGVEGWMADFLFQDNVGASTIDASLLSVTG